MKETRPFLRSLIVDENVGLVEESCKTPLNTQLLCCGTGMIFSAGAPAVELGSLSEEFGDVTDDSSFGSFFPIDSLDQRFVHVDVDEQWVFHISEVRTAPPRRIAPLAPAHDKIPGWPCCCSRVEMILELLARPTGEEASYLLVEEEVSSRGARGRRSSPAPEHLLIPIYLCLTSASLLHLSRFLRRPK